MQLDVVTGATGHLGNVLVRELISRGRTVRAVLQPGDDHSALCGLPVQLFEADIRDRVVLRAAFSGAERVFHLAGRVSFGSAHPEHLRELNVGGTRAVLDACRYAHVKRLVHMGAANALTDPASGVLDEEAGFDPTRAHGTWAQTAAEACAVVLSAVRAGEVDAVLVLPTAVVGPMDWRLSEVGQLLLDLERRRVRFLLAGGHDWVDVRDVAKGTATAADRGRAGESYLLGGERLELRELARVVEEETGVAPPPTLPAWAARSLATPAPLVEALTHRRALFTPWAVHELTAPWAVSHEKAARELDFKPASVRKALRDALDWHHAHPSLRGRPLLRRAANG